MTNTIKENQIEGTLRRLVGNTELDLTIDHNASGYTLYLLKDGKVMKMLAFGNSKAEI